MRGTVKFFNSEKGYGFITPNGGGKDVFFHKSSVKKGAQTEGVPVEYDVTNNDRGIAAANVTEV